MAAIRYGADWAFLSGVGLLILSGIFAPLRAEPGVYLVVAGPLAAWIVGAVYFGRKPMNAEEYTNDSENGGSE